MRYIYYKGREGFNLHVEDEGGNIDLVNDDNSGYESNDDVEDPALSTDPHDIETVHFSTSANMSAGCPSTFTRGRKGISTRR